MGHTSFVRSIDWSPDGTKIASGSADGTIRIWNASGGSLLSILTNHSDVVTKVVWSPDSSKLASGSFDETMRIWDVANGELEATINVNNGSGVFSLDWSPSGDKIVYDRDLGYILPTIIQLPTANAGTDQTVSTLNSTASVTLDGSGSSDVDGSIVSYIWTDSTGAQVVTGVSPTVDLPVGEHTLTLTVTDDDGATASDEVDITVVNP